MKYKIFIRLETRNIILCYVAIVTEVVVQLPLETQIFFPLYFLYISYFMTELKIYHIPFSLYSFSTFSIKITK